MICSSSWKQILNRRQRTWLLVFLLFLVAALLRISLAVRPGLWADEIFSLAMATGHSLEHAPAEANPALGDFVEPRSAQPPATFRRYMQHETPPAGARRVIRAVFLSDTNPPLYYLLLNLWTRNVGTSDAALRLFSTFWALACFPLLWVLAKEVGDQKTAWTACILFTFVPPALYYSAEGRMYSLVWFLALVMAISSFALARRGPRPQWFLLWCLSAAAGLLTHYFFTFVLGACLAWLWLYPGRISRGHLAGAAALVGLLILPWYLRIPESLGLWRVTAGWLRHPLSWDQTLIAPLKLAWSLLSGQGAWGSLLWTELFAVALYALLGFAILKRRMWSLFSQRPRLLWFWLLAACFGVVVFDWMMGIGASRIPRYALPGEPAAILMAALALSKLPRRAHIAFLLLIVLAWLPAYQFMSMKPSRWWEPYPDVAARLDSPTGATDLVIVHSIPSGVLGVARYMATGTPIASWVVQLGRRRVPEDLQALLTGRQRVALVKIHDLGEPSPAEAWLLAHARLERHDKWDRTAEDQKWNKTEILFFTNFRG